MKSIKFLSILAILLSLLAYQSCKKTDLCDAVICLNGGICDDGICTGCDTGYSGDTCENHCSANVSGVYNVTNGTNVSNLESYTFSKGSSDTEVLIILAFPGSSFSATGRLSADCSTLTYTFDDFPSLGDGVITFSGDTLSDQYNSGGEIFVYEATK